jgi:hypothetical protein
MPKKRTRDPVREAKFVRLHQLESKCVKKDIRICFAIKFFKTEQDADEYAKQVRECGLTYNGGMFHGMPCGREKSWDHIDPELGKLYAVTD